MRLSRRIFQAIAGKVPLTWADRLIRNSVNQHHFSALKHLPVHAERERLWDVVLESAGGPGTAITYIEFGVWEGKSIKYMASKNTHPDSLFIGLDTFEGLEQEWIKVSMKDFDVRGNIPSIKDERVSFLKGYFQDTFDELHKIISGRKNFVIHFDADLYSSTLFALTRLDPLIDSYHAIFDEFHSGENLALYNYMDAYMAQNEFIGSTSDEAMRVASRITTRKPIL